jgi:hypothetical protein
MGLEILRDESALVIPPAIVCAERLRATRKWNAIKPGLGDREARSSIDFFEFENDKRRRLGRVVNIRLYGKRMPAEREEPRSFDALDGDMKRLSFVRGLELRNLGVHRRAANATPNHAPNSRASLMARHTRAIGAFNMTFF